MDVEGIVVRQIERVERLGIIMGIIRVLPIAQWQFAVFLRV